MSDDNVFHFTADHLRLLRGMYIGWQDVETGAPEVDPKRPYGNGDVPADVAELLGWEPADTWDDERVLSAEQRARAYELHRETKTALQIAVRNLGGPLVGVWQRERFDYFWNRARFTPAPDEANG